MSGSGLADRLEVPVRELLAGCGRLVAERGEGAYLVGGRVRDLVLGVDSTDLDIVVTGDGLAVAQAFARQHDGHLTRYHAFQTARVDLAEGLRVDFATARSELYPRPGDLPRVAIGTLEEDLARRDFTINTMALDLTPGGWDQLTDPFDGRGDIANGVIRFLHERSFADDPTRMLRGIRFALRLGYNFEEGTESALYDGGRGRFLDSISGVRLQRELAKLLDEAQVTGPEALARYDLLDSLTAGLEARPDALQALRREVDATPRIQGEPWTRVLALLAARLDGQERWRLTRRLRLTREQREPLVDSGVTWERVRLALTRLPDSAPPSAIATLLDGISASALVVVLAANSDLRQTLVGWLRSYLGTGRHVHAQLDGDRLLAMGIAEGPLIGELLGRLRSARLDGEVETEAEEVALVRSWIDSDTN